MGNEIKVCGTQNFMGIEIPVVEGGFGKNQKVILAKTVAAIHGVRLNDIQNLIRQNMDEFEKGIDLLDLCDENFKTDAVGLGFITSNRQKNCYLLSEQGYMLLVGFMKTDKAKEIRKNLRREYFSMRAELSSIQQQKAMLLLTIYGGGQDAVVASKELSQIEIEEATAPLTAENERKQQIINGFTGEVPIYQKPDIINRICRKSQGGYANRYKELYKCFKENFHADLVKRCENYNKKQPKKKDQLTIIRFAEKFGYIDDLYTCCAKLYESEIQEVLKELNELHK